MYWYALKDSTIDNKCLKITKKNHLIHSIRQRLIKDVKKQVWVLNLNESLWAKRLKKKKKEKYKYERLKVTKEILMFFHKNLLHRNNQNRNEKNKMIYTFSIVNDDAHMFDDLYLKFNENELNYLWKR